MQSHRKENTFKIFLERIKETDVKILQEIGTKVFTESFSWGNTEDNLNHYLDEAFSTGKLLEELTDPDSQFYFAIINEQPIGYIKINFGKAQTELKGGNSIEIERIYILHEFQGMRIGQFFMNEILHIAKKHPVDFIWLGVWEKNPGAIRFYERNGFIRFDQHTFKMGTDEQTDLMMKLDLKSIK